MRKSPSEISSLEPTRYEITARHADGRELLVVYTSQKSRNGLLKAIRGNASVLFPEDALFYGLSAKPLPHVTCCNWIIGFSGRTQRQAYSEGERPFVLESVNLLPQPSPLD